jgi:hypothetical protein
MSDPKAQITAQAYGLVTSAVTPASVPATVDAVPTIVKALTPLIDQLVNSTNSEPFYQSRVFWGSTVAAVGVGLNYFHVDFPAAIQGQVTDAIMALIPIAGSLYALYGRFKAKKPIGS